MKRQLLPLTFFMLAFCGVSHTAVAQDFGDENEIIEVDLGLSVNWASCNIGATTPDDFGTYFQWGETSPSKTYEAATCKTLDKDGEWLESNGYIQWTNAFDGDMGGILTPAHDAAQTLWGDGWRMPTVKELRELQSRCEIMPYNVNGVDGWLYISKVPGYTENSIFIPGTGYMGATEEDFNEGYPKDQIIDSPEYAYFWTRDYYPTDDVTGRDWRISGDGTGQWLDEYRFYGFPIRPVKDKKH